MNLADIQFQCTSERIDCLVCGRGCKRLLTGQFQKKPGLAGIRRRAGEIEMFCDIRGFTAMSEHQPPEETIELLNVYYTLMFEAIDSHGGIVSLMIGDGLMALFGAPRPLEDHAGHAVLAAQDMLALLGQFNLERDATGKPPLEIGIGIATGEVVAGYAGTQQRATYTCIGDSVNLAARLEAHTKVARYPILMDATTRAVLGDRVGVTPVPDVELKGFSGRMTVYGANGS